MFQKLFDKVDEFIEKFNEITNLEQFAMEVLKIIEKTLKTNLSGDKETNEKTFDEIMQKPGLWKSIGEKMKKALKNKEEMLKYLLYICIVMIEFDRRYRERQHDKRKDAEVDKIIKKYTKIISEISENLDIPKEQKDSEIKKLRQQMEKEIKSLSLTHER